MSSDASIFVNGIDLSTGNYARPPQPLDAAVAMLRSEPDDSGARDYLGQVATLLESGAFGLPFDVHPEEPAEAGWAILFHTDEDPAIREALRPLVEHRRRQIGNDAIVQELEYRGGESLADWQLRYKASPGSVEPEILPYYILIVGGPERIPFLFQHLLDVEYAVGRLHFDTVEDYDRYARSLIAYETADSVPNAREAVFFATRHEFDDATELSADHLVKPLIEGRPEAPISAARKPVAERFRFGSRVLWGDEATKDALLGVLRAEAGSKPPALLFTASHGIASGMAEGLDRQKATSGALLCQDWPGFGVKPTAAHLLAAADVPDDARVQGLIGFHFACFGAGTPSHDRFAHRKDGPPPRIAEEAFVSALPKRLLAHPNGGALAVVGHVERAWGCSIALQDVDQSAPFRSALSMLLTGWPVGHALKDFGDRYASLSTRLLSKLELPLPEDLLEKRRLVFDWTQRNDAEGFVVLGDPAARLRVDLLV